jgi:hypothetical protein
MRRIVFVLVAVVALAGVVAYMASAGVVHRSVGGFAVVKVERTPSRRSRRIFLSP